VREGIKKPRNLSAAGRWSRRDVPNDYGDGDD